MSTGSRDAAIAIARKDIAPRPQSAHICLRARLHAVNNCEPKPFAGLMSEEANLIIFHVGSSRYFSSSSSVRPVGSPPGPCGRAPPSGSICTSSFTCNAFNNNVSFNFIREFTRYMWLEATVL
ncbi:hypothetical protein Aduo_007170 [Ancylostoma duodenale]